MSPIKIKKQTILQTLMILNLCCPYQDDESDTDVKEYNDYIKSLFQIKTTQKTRRAIQYLLHLCVLKQYNIPFICSIEAKENIQTASYHTAIKIKEEYLRI